MSKSTNEGRFSRVLKCSHQRLLRPSLSLMSVFPSDDSSGMLPEAEGFKTVFSDLKNSWRCECQRSVGLQLLCPATNGSKISLDFSLEGLKLLVLGNRGRVI